MVKKMAAIKVYLPYFSLISVTFGLDLNPDHLVSELTALPTVPQPLSYESLTIF